MNAEENSLVVSTGLTHPGVVVVERPSIHETEIEIALFVSRTDHPSQLPSTWLAEIDSCPQVQVSHTKGDRGDPFFLVPRSEWLAVDIPQRGPCVIETRLRYDKLEARRQQSYQVLLRYDGQPARVIDFETTAESRKLYTVDGRFEVFGNGTA